MSNKKRLKTQKTARPHGEPGNRPDGSQAIIRPLRVSLTHGLFSIDHRSLALFRIAISVVLLLDLAIRATDLTAMHTDDGMFSRVLICQYYTSVWNWSFHFGSGSAWFQSSLFAISALFAVALLLGYKTRIATIGSWLMLISLHNRVPPILNGADNLLRMLLFWAMFLPLDRVWSIQAKSCKQQESGSHAGEELSFASAAIMLQMAMMYLFTAVFKSNNDWLQGETLAVGLSHDFYARPIGSWLLQFPTLLTLITLGVLYLEWLGPLLLFVPWKTPRIRIVVVFLLVAMHLGIEILMTVGLFSYASLVGLTLFIPAEFWQWIRTRFGRTKLQCNEFSVTPDRNRSIANSLTQWFCSVVFAYILFVNVNGLPEQWVPWTPKSTHDFLTISCGLGQKWDMFGEAPSKDGWYVAQAVLSDGSKIDLLRDGEPVTWERPRNPAGIYRNHRWSKCFREMSYEDAIGYQVFRQPIAEYLCREWAKRHDAEKQISEFSLVFCQQETTIDEMSLGPRTRRDTLVLLNPEMRRSMQLRNAHNSSR
ncbi:MAG: HTTM domain-containing protein [Planctomycetales bacterium]|nr:HTTM domain-containing protein [Planctomycetales bacterium]